MGCGRGPSPPPLVSYSTWQPEGRESFVLSYGFFLCWDLNELEGECFDR